jgi:hypothetical protein
LLATLLLATWAGAESATTKDRARLRQGPSAATELLGEVEPGTTLELLGESGGWRQVRTPDGKTGYVWSEHFAARPDDAKAAEPGRAAAPRTIAEEVRDLRDEVSALRQRPEPASAAALERVRQELERLAAAERDLARRLDDRFVPGAVPADPPGDGAGALWPGLLVAGGVAGFVASRVLQHRRERRQRSRLRL